MPLKHKQTPRASGGRQPLSRERILEAALRFVDAQGLQALSMRKLAADLGVEAMSLYNHIDNKDDILAGITDLVFAEVEIPSAESGDWDRRLRCVSETAREALSRPSNVVPIILAGPHRAPPHLTHAGRNSAEATCSTPAKAVVIGRTWQIPLAVHARPIWDGDARMKPLPVFRDRVSRPLDALCSSRKNDRQYHV